MRLNNMNQKKKSSIVIVWYNKEQVEAYAP